MKTIISTQIGFIIGSLILLSFGKDFSLILTNIVVLNLGYFCRYFQENKKSNKPLDS